MNHKMKVYLVVFARKALQLFKSLIDDIQKFIDENYVDAAENTYNRNFECREATLPDLSNEKIFPGERPNQSPYKKTNHY